MGMTKEERLQWLQLIEEQIYVSSLESTFADDMKSVAIHSIIEEETERLENKNDDKQIPKQVELMGDGYDPDGNLVYDYAQCKALEYKKFIELSKDEIKQIVTDIFHPKKITNIEIHKKVEEITCTIYTEWEGRDEEINLIADTLTLRNPFEYGEDAIEVNFSVGYDDYLKLKQFCFARGIFSENWIKDNPYLQEDENQESEVNK